MRTPENSPSISDIDTAPANLPLSDSPVPFDEFEKLRVKFTEVTALNEELRSEVAQLKRVNRTAAKLDSLIKPYAFRTFCFMCCYCVGVAAILLLQGFGAFRAPLAEGVIQVLVGSTAATVLGLVGMVLTGIFVGARRK